MPSVHYSVSISFPLWRRSRVTGHGAGGDMCRGIGCSPLSACEPRGPGSGGGQSETAAGPGSCGDVVPLTASARQHFIFVLHLASARQGPAVHGAWPQRHRLQPHAAAAAGGG